MKLKFLILFIVVVIATSCNTKPKQTEEKIIGVEQLMSALEENIDHEISIQGTVNHVCSHSGRRCFLIDSTGEYSIKVEAAGNIESFSKEDLGADIKVKGILKEERLTADEIDEWEVEVLEKHPEEAENEGENCSAEMSNINSMRAWMKENGKDYYAIYYFEGLSYEVVE